MLQNFFESVSLEKLVEYHVIFDNFFTSPDLLVYLKKLGLVATGTVRQNRVYEMKVVKQNRKAKEKRVPVPVELHKKSDRGNYEVKHDQISKVNYISVKDSKIVSLLTSAAGVVSLTSVKRWSSTAKEKPDLSFSQAFTIYNKFMGWVDLHDQHCNDLRILIRTRK